MFNLVHGVVLVDMTPVDLGKVVAVTVVALGVDISITISKDNWHS